MSRIHIHTPKNIGDAIADKVAAGMGSWHFIIIQTVVLVLWIVLNSVAWFIWKWDSYPFIAMNLLLSCQAAYAAPIIMKSQNRQAQKDRARDDVEAEEVQELYTINKQQLDELAKLDMLDKRITRIENDIARLVGLIDELPARLTSTRRKAS